QPAQPLNQVPQPAPLLFRPAPTQVDAVVPQVDAGEDHLLAAVLDERAYLGDDLVRRPAAEARPHGGDDAVGAVEQAAVLDLDEGALVAVEARNAGGQLQDAELAQLFGEAVLVRHHLGDA